MELGVLLCIILIPLVILIVTAIFIINKIRLRRLNKAKLERCQALFIPPIQNYYLPNNTNYMHDPNRRISNLSTVDISTINVDEQAAAFSLYQSNQSIHSTQTGVREHLSEYTKPPAYNPNYC